MPISKVLDYSKLSTITPLVRRLQAYRASGTILDIGARFGRDSLFLAKQGWRVTALDNDSGSLNQIRIQAKNKGLAIKTILADINTYISTEKFDGVVASMVLHYIPQVNVPRVISALKGATTLGGWHAISVQTDKNKLSSIPYLFKIEELKRYYGD